MTPEIDNENDVSFMTHRKGKKMERKKLKYYGCLIALILILSCLVPLGINAVTNLIVGQLTAEELPETEIETGMGSETETENSEKMRVTIQTAQEDPVRSRGLNETALQETEEDLTGQIQEEKEAYEQSLIRYRKMNQPDYTETQKGALQAFIGTREDLFTEAISDYVYSKYGDSMRIKKVDIIEFVKEDDDELTYQIEVTAANGTKEYSEYFISSYNKGSEFYSIYAYQQR